MNTSRWTYLAVGMASVVAYYFIPYGDVSNILYLVVSASAPVAIVWGMKRHQPSKRLPWILLAVGFALYVIGDAIYTAYLYTDLGYAPFPNIGDAAYLAFYPLVFVSLGRFMRAVQHRDRAAWLDASIWSTGAALLLWEPVIEPFFSDTETGFLIGAMGLAYPLLDVVLLLMVLRMFAGRTARTPAYWMLMAGLASQTVADILYALQVADSIANGGKLLDILWLATYIWVGAAALHPTMAAMTEPSLGAPVLSSRIRLVALLIPTLFAPGLLVYMEAAGQLGEDALDGVVVAISTSILVLLVLARGTGLLTVAERRSDELAHGQAALQRALAEREESNTELYQRVTTDPLTGLANRSFFVEALEASLVEAGSTSIAFLDLDDFKSINDTLGHEAGDLVLVDLAERLRGSVGPGDLVARFGGDEFAVLLTGDVEDMAATLLDTLRQPILLHGRELRCQVSIGVTTAGDGSPTTGDMLRRADIAMYAAKKAGGGWSRYQSGMSAVLRRRVDLRARLVKGLQSGEVRPWFQPVVDLRSGELHGFEALARWLPDGGEALVAGDWVPMAEESGLVVDVDRTVCRAAFTQLAAWRAEHASAQDLHVAINLSARTLQQVGIAEELIGMLVVLGVPANRIVVEVTEGVLIQDEKVSARLQLLRAAGMRVALDDFGTGWSSLSYLQKFPVDMLKLDRSFTSGLGLTPGGEAIPAAVLQLARAMSLGVVAEGVETLGQLESLVQLGFHDAQGYLFARAEPADQLDGLLRRKRPQYDSAATRTHEHALKLDAATDSEDELKAAAAALIVTG